MCNADVKNAYKAFVYGSLQLKNEGSIPEHTFQAMVTGASLHLINHHFAHSFNSYIERKVEPHFHNSLQRATHF